MDRKLKLYLESKKIEERVRSSSQKFANIQTLNLQSKSFLGKLSKFFIDLSNSPHFYVVKLTKTGQFLSYVLLATIEEVIKYQDKLKPNL